MRLLLLAAPGGGKGTQGDRLSAMYRIQHISSGDVLRAAARADTPLGREVAAYQQRGDLVLADLVVPVEPARTPAFSQQGVNGNRGTSGLAHVILPFSRAGWLQAVVFTGQEHS